ncbi:hypothetical protein MP228_007692 [Amoeboaphelidium protococcarum]|nr:hypothetical protein MP228_007692 [Amoeboaphelidium protococcarum]
MAFDYSKRRDSDSAAPLLDAPSVSSQRLTGALFFSVFSAILASFCFGWSIGVVNNPKEIILTCELDEDAKLPSCIHMSTLEWGIVVAIFAIGGLFGGLLGGKLCNSLGRKKTLQFNTLILLASSILMGLSVDVITLAAGRLLVGFGCGVATSAVPLYISEISPIKQRGTLGTLNQLAVVIGILTSQVIGLWLSTVPGWRLLLSGAAIPAFIQLVALFFCPESPSYLVQRGKMYEAEMSLAKLRASRQVGLELDALVVSQRESSSESGDLSIAQLFTRKSLRKALIIGLTAQLAQQLSGINGVMQYSSSIFKDVFPGQEKLVTVGVGIVNLVSTLLSLALMDRAGRRILLLTSQLGIVALCIVVVAASLANSGILVVIAVALFTAMFAIGLGPIPWLIIPEIFPTYAVSPASSVSVCVNWLSNFLVSLLFEQMLMYLKAYTFVPFGAITFGTACVIFYMMPETKGRSVDEIASILS